MNKFLQRALLALTVSITPAIAANIPFDQANFENLLKQGKPVVLHIHADWCPTCRAQQAVLDDLLPLVEYKDLPVLRANFDNEKTLLRTYKIRKQSTFIIFKNGKEVTRSTGETDSTRIAALLNMAK